MPAASLLQGNEREPTNKVSIDYRPSGSTTHWIADGDNWGTLQERYGIPAKTIIEANFKTTVPEEINWYLHHYVNCDTTTPDRYNWRFSTSARNGPSPRAGIIYIPPTVYVFDDDIIVIPPRRIQFDACMAQSRVAPETRIPATISSDWKDFPSPVIRQYAAAGLCVASYAARRLTRVLATSSQEANWNGGPEYGWFGDYSPRKAKKVHGTFLEIVQILARPRLRIYGDNDFSSYGDALPSINRIKLGRDWRTPLPEKPLLPDHERVQTFVHEAAHIAGRFSGDEGDFYGPKASRKLAKLRMRPTRHADCYGYYSLEVAGVPVP
jgi:hypothetical protein